MNIIERHMYEALSKFGYSCSSVYVSIDDSNMEHIVFQYNVTLTTNQLEMMQAANKNLPSFLVSDFFDGKELQIVGDQNGIKVTDKNVCGRSVDLGPLMDVVLGFHECLSFNLLTLRNKLYFKPVVVNRYKVLGQTIKVELVHCLNFNVSSWDRDVFEQTIELIEKGLVQMSSLKFSWKDIHFAIEGIVFRDNNELTTHIQAFLDNKAKDVFFLA